MQDFNFIAVAAHKFKLLYDAEIKTGHLNKDIVLEFLKQYPEFNSINFEDLENAIYNLLI